MSINCLWYQRQKIFSESPWNEKKKKKNQGIEKNSQKNHGLKKWGIWKKWKQKLANWKMNKEKQSWNLNEKLIK